MKHWALGPRTASGAPGHALEEAERERLVLGDPVHDHLDADRHHEQPEETVERVDARGAEQPGELTAEGETHPRTGIGGP